MKVTRRGLLTTGAIVGGGFVIGATGLGVFVQNYDRRALQKEVFKDAQ